MAVNAIILLSMWGQRATMSVINSLFSSPQVQVPVQHLANCTRTRSVQDFSLKSRISPYRSSINGLQFI